MKVNYESLEKDSASKIVLEHLQRICQVPKKEFALQQDLVLATQPFSLVPYIHKPACSKLQDQDVFSTKSSVWSIFVKDTFYNHVPAKLCQVCFSNLLAKTKSIPSAFPLESMHSTFRFLARLWEIENLLSFDYEKLNFPVAIYHAALEDASRFIYFHGKAYKKDTSVSVIAPEMFLKMVELLEDYETIIKKRIMEVYLFLISDAHCAAVLKKAVLHTSDKVLLEPSWCLVSVDLDSVSKIVDSEFCAESEFTNSTLLFELVNLPKVLFKRYDHIIGLCLIPTASCKYFTEANVILDSFSLTQKPSLELLELVASFYDWSGKTFAVLENVVASARSALK